MTGRAQHQDLHLLADLWPRVPLHVRQAILTIAINAADLDR